MSQNINDMYLERIKSIDFINLKRKREGNLKWRKYEDFKIKWKYNWLVMKSGFYYGGISGAALGIVFGIVPAVKHGQISILLASMCFSGGMFSCIGGFGSLLHSR